MDNTEDLKSPIIQVKLVEKCIADALSIEDVNEVKFIIKNVNEAGANYVTDVFRVVAEHGIDSELTRHCFFMKVVMPYPFDDDNDDPKFCKTEEFAYTCVLEEISRMEEQFGISDPEDRVHRAHFVSYFVDEHGIEYFVLKDLTSEGYKAGDRNKRLDMNHMKVTIKELAKIHGTSFAMKALESEKYSDIIRKGGDRPLLSYLDMFMECIKLQITKVESLINKESIKIKFNKLTKNFLGLLNKLLKKAVIESCTAICHGDLWTTNIMFQYNQEGNPERAILIDWQSVSCNSPPVLDLYHLLVTSFSDESMTVSNFKFLIDLYYENLSKVIGRYCLRVEDLYPELVYRSQLKEFAPLGLNTALMNVCYHTRSPDDICSPEEVIQHPLSSIEMSEESEQRFAAMWNYLLVCFDECGLLDHEPVNSSLYSSIQ